MYLGHAGAFKIPKVVVEAGFNFDQVWKRANNCILSKEASDLLLLLVHNKLLVRERLFRVGVMIHIVSIVMVLKLRIYSCFDFLC